MDRRTFFFGAVALTAGTPLRANGMTFDALEAAHGGRLGVAALDTANGEQIAYRENERFPLCSTFKLLAAAAVLKRVDLGEDQLDRVIAYSQSDLLEYAPVTRANVGKGGMPVGDLCDAAMTLSDNTAGNLLLDQLGGPAGLTRYVRSLGDTVTRLDRNEPTLNTALPDDPRDTTSPAAMVSNLKRLLIEDELSKNSRATLLAWMRNCRTAAKRIPAGLPPGWKSGDKTGSGDRGTANDVAIIERPGAAPILVAAYYTGSPASAPERDSVLADVGRIVCSRFRSA
ncbi:class A beta-lactamase [Hyphomicrobium sp.]|uniref:class A beta-lactamase n=1 Tax=Hyphomicrobium sp. TaxID=82 RepID=UPI002D7944B0|nr:class A beta-lactamase [Hyphomicrobium sp.]HET6388753.1 class A beta-lactamase [Hyphomicrobium sp.]